MICVDWLQNTDSWKTWNSMIWRVVVSRTPGCAFSRTPAAFHESSTSRHDSYVRRKQNSPDTMAASTHSDGNWNPPWRRVSWLHWWYPLPATGSARVDVAWRCSHGSAVSLSCWLDNQRSRCPVDLTTRCYHGNTNKGFWIGRWKTIYIMHRARGWFNTRLSTAATNVWISHWSVPLLDGCYTSDGFCWGFWWLLVYYGW